MLLFNLKIITLKPHLAGGPVPFSIQNMADTEILFFTECYYLMLSKSESY